MLGLWYKSFPGTGSVGSKECDLGLLKEWSVKMKDE